jgi:hypothetical protein
LSLVYVGQREGRLQVHPRFVAEDGARILAPACHAAYRQVVRVVVVNLGHWRILIALKVRAQHLMVAVGSEIGLISVLMCVYRRAPYAAMVFARHFVVPMVQKEDVRIFLVLVRGSICSLLSLPLSH